ncbi:MAG: APC family permease [Oscillospiraceae bacterium]
MDNNNLQKRYGLTTAIAMVVGIVIGSGVFFKAGKILEATNGDLKIAIIAWLIGGSIMIACAYTFALLAARIEKVNGIVDYAEAALGNTYAYIVGWFLAVIYYPTLAAVLSWVAASYTAVILGFSNTSTSGEVFIIAALYMISIYALNCLSPILAGKFQVSTTLIKLVPLVLIGIIGIIFGLTSGQTVENFTLQVSTSATSNPLLTSVVATSFAYEGWIIATSINAELKDAKKNLPKALTFGTIAIVVIYILYFIGLSSAMPTSEMISGGDSAVNLAFSRLLGPFAGSALFIFVVISCLGTLNGLMLGCSRGIYSLAVRNMSIKPEVFSQVDPITKIPTNSSVVGLLLIICWLTVWFGNLAEWWPLFLDISELPAVSMYALYIPIFIWLMKNVKDLNPFQRFVVPSLSIAGSLFMIFSAFVAHGYESVLIYLVIFIIIVAIGLSFKGNNTNNKINS